MKQEKSSLRLDKWLWAIRVFKTRSDAADSCKANRVWINDSFAKPSREVKVGDVIAIRKSIVTYTFRVLELIANRQPAKNVHLYAEDITPQSEKEKLNTPKETVFISRDRGTGRPTKKERRDIDGLMTTISYDDIDDMDNEELS